MLVFGSAVCEALTSARSQMRCHGVGGNPEQDQAKDPGPNQPNQKQKTKPGTETGTQPTGTQMKETLNFGRHCFDERGRIGVCSLSETTKRGAVRLSCAELRIPISPPFSLHTFSTGRKRVGSKTVSKKKKHSELNVNYETISTPLPCG